MHNFDPKQQFEAIKKSAVDAVQEVFPIDGKLRTIKLDKIWVDDSLDSTDYASQANAKSKEATWGTPVYAALTLIEKSSGKVIDHTEKTKLFTLPKITSRLSYIVGGNEYQVTNQLRLKPGVYTIRKQNGELKTQINLSKGKNFDIVFNERTGVFFIQKIGGGQTNIPLYPILTYLGISPSMITGRWGSKLEAANRLSDPKVVTRAATAFGAKLGDLKEYFASTSTSSETTQLVLGKGFDRVDGPMLLEASSHLLEVQLGKKEATDRDSLAFKELLSVEDFVHERIQKNKQTLAFKLKRSIDNLRRTKLTQLVNPGAFGSVIENFFTQDDKATTPEQTNPLEMLSGQYAATMMGAGGITSRHSIKKEMREIHPSHYGFIDPIHTPESSNIGVNLHIPLGVKKDGKIMRTMVVDKNKKETLLNVSEAFNKYIAFPEQGETSGTVKVQYKGKVLDIPRAKVDYFTPSSQVLFSPSTNLIPFLASNQGNRAMMASKMLEQAIALKHREAPLVQIKMHSDENVPSMEGAIGNSLAIMSPENGTVFSVDTDSITIQTDKGEKVKLNIYKDFSLNRKSFMNHDVLVKKGDKVKKGQLLADSNYTKGGTLALGTNMRVAYLPYKGLNFEDGIVITDTAASKLTSEHIHKKTIELGAETVLSLATYGSFYPNALTPENMRKLDKSGVVMKGEKIKQGDTLIALVQKRAASAAVASISKALSTRPKDISVHWTYEDSGIVMDVQRSGKKITVFIKTEEVAKIGDKLSGRMGNKGIITSIIPDKEAPHDAKGNPIEIMLNPHGVITRINIGQIYESAAGKVALKEGKTHKVQNFTGEDYLDTTKKLLAKASIDDKEELFDPITKKSLGKVHVGNPYILKLFKQGTVNFSTRQGGPGQPYDANQQPLKAGGEEASKSMDLLTIYSLMSHGARANLREMSSIKSNQNDEFWKALKSGQQLPPPQTPFVYDKFINYLKGAGIDVKKDGSKLTLAPLTDAQVRDMSSGEIKKSMFYRGKDLQPIAGGFFDKNMTGGIKGKKWSHVDLKEPTINPVFEVAVRKITGLGTKLDDVIAGKLFIAKDGTYNSEGKGVTGGHAVTQILKDVDVDKNISSLLRKAEKATGPALDDINKQLRYLQALKDNKMEPHEAYMRNAIPIIPPIFRPVYPLPNGNMAASDINFLYQNTGVLNEMMGLPVMSLLAEDEKSDIRKDIYDHVKGISGLTDLNIKGRERAGFISEIKGGKSGGQPKEGFFISKMLSKKQDFVGRGTIIPEPDLGIDEVALPEEMAWKLFEPFLSRELKTFGKTPLQAKDEIARKTPLARKALDIIMRDRHVLLNRAPSLHKFSIMALKPKITEGRAIKIPPLIVKGLNADFDGDEQLTSTWTYLTDAGISLCREIYGTKFVEDRTMTARFKEMVPAINEGGDLLLINLADFPHTGELLGSKMGEKGKIDFYRALPGTKVVALDEKTGAISWQDVYGWSKHYQREIEVVTLSSGRQILTDDDPRAVYGIEHGKLEFTRNTPSAALETKMFVPRAHRLEAITQPDPLGRPCAEHTFEMGYVIGSMAANGWVESCHEKLTGRFFIASISEEVGTRFLDFSEKIFNTKNSRLEYHRQSGGENCYGESKKWGLCDNKAAHFLADSVGTGAREKHLPPYFLNAPERFRLGLFAGLMDNDGSISVSNAKAKSKPQLMLNYTSASVRLIQEVQILAGSLGIRARITPTKTPAGEPFWCCGFSSIDAQKWECHGMVHAGKLAKFASCAAIEDSAVAAKYDIVPISSELAGAMCKAIGYPRNGSPDRKSLYAIFAKAKTVGSVSRQTALRVFSWVPEEVCCKLPSWDAWWKIVQNTDVTWDQVEFVEKSGIKEDGYDLTVPGYETFMNTDGVILSNTMTVHVPITNEANEEAKKMLPSANLFKPGTGALMIAPSQEAQIGLFYLSKTPAGIKQLAAIVGPKFPIEKILNKKGTGDLLMQLAKEMPAQEYARVVAKLKSLGEQHAYDRGFTLGMNDIVDMRKERNLIVGEALKSINSKSTEAHVQSVNDKASKMMDALVEKKLKGKDNPLYDMVESGARGDRTQLRSIVATPLFVTDAHSKIVPTPIKKSYAEGLDISDYWVSLYGARRGGLDRSIQTSVPGAFSKDIMASTIDNVVSSPDCGTKDGIMLGTTDSDVLERFLAGEQGGLPHNTLVTSSVVNALSKKGLKMLKVRSPLTCHQAKGVCSKCHGLDEHGVAPGVGENVGAKAGQTIAEPLVQMVMNTRHSGGVAGTGSNVGGYARINQLLQLPKIVHGSATLSPRTGKVTKIEKGLAGGFNIWVGTEKAFVAQGLPLKVAVGSEVVAGDPLSEGVIKPQELVKYKGMQPAQEYIVNELHSSYKAQGAPLHRRVFETIVRSLGNTTKILNNPKDSEYLPGDVAAYAVIKAHNENLKQRLPAEMAEGLHLAEAVAGLKVGKILTHDDLALLKAKSVKDVMIEREEIKHAPFLKGMSTLPLLRKDWMASLGYRYLAKSLTEGAAQGWKTDVSDYHPIPALAQGTTFGKGKDGKY